LEQRLNQKISHRLLPDASRVITKPFLPGEEKFSGVASRVEIILCRVLALPEAEVTSLLARLLRDFGSRHRDYEQILESSFANVAHHLSHGVELTRERGLLIGAYFTHEFSIEAAALFNPSIVAAPDQSALQPGELRFIMSARAVGEGHLSSIEFRTGIVDADGGIVLDPLSPYAMTGHRETPIYDKQLFSTKLTELGADMTSVAGVLEPLPAEFSYKQLSASIGRIEKDHSRGSVETLRLIHWLSSSNYVVTFPGDSQLAERVIFPAGPNESRGMEDARFVRFIDDDGSVTYYATYTAFDGVNILPQCIVTKDFLSFRIETLNGSGARNKGMAFFPRRIDGRYAMLGRCDAESIFLMTSDNVRLWNRAEKIHVHMRSWELVQMGNCGSPIETADGWLVLTHGVGPMRRYSIGAMLLDIDDPRRVVAQLPEPLLLPSEADRNGYVPNVVYSCGSLVHRDHLVLPYGFSDFGIAFMTLSLGELLESLRANQV
jgi:predicted GH43/DUF377 family glycosyl hydrolase